MTGDEVLILSTDHIVLGVVTTAWIICWLHAYTFLVTLHFSKYRLYC